MSIKVLLEHFDDLLKSPEAVRRLRRFVLDLAVRGKLVEQHADDEPAADLLKRIVAEKSRLIKAGELNKPKPLRPAEETPFDLPSGWLWTRPWLNYVLYPTWQVAEVRSVRWRASNFAKMCPVEWSRPQRCKASCARVDCDLRAYSFSP